VSDAALEERPSGLVFPDPPGPLQSLGDGLNGRHQFSLPSPPLVIGAHCAVLLLSHPTLCVQRNCLHGDIKDVKADYRVPVL
jgi:hypothetical protein